ncbi:MAG: phospho-N-acetylmuramoyl-pentapeptide-transferase [Lachnospiraceae bacterium]|nr:phospho-N-acetylmuramoyl-pentapeptide-transferase [Lachnospiraceae bacterium]
MLLSVAGSASPLIFILGLAVTFILTFVLLGKLKSKLPCDIGRAYAVNAAAAKGKPRGAGIIFVLVFAFMTLLMEPLSIELSIYLVMIIAAMLTGFLDDRSNKPWSELKKGLCDFGIALVCALTFVFNNPSSINLLLFNTQFTIPSWLYALLALILIWVSINVTNCTDGVDGLSSSLSVVTLLSFYAVFKQTGAGEGFSNAILVMLCCVMPYIWYNCSPSILLMGDAGSRALGLFFALTAMKSGDPIAFIPLTLVFIVDGGLGLIKVSLIRYFKLHILKNTITPLHDNARKNHGWSDARTVMRFVILQCVISTLYLYFAFVY